MVKVRFLRNMTNNTMGLYDDNMNLIIMLPTDFKVSFFDDINIKKVKPFLTGTSFKKLVCEYDYVKLESVYYLK